ncbi:LamG domain-containing protein [Candidatus Woesearchaeota archaeon]|nr:LamG domain-containing protein [Candidatus Woesearchaeota archaeon]
MNRHARLALKTLPIILATILLLLASFGAATQMDSTNYNQTKTASASGGDNLSSTNYLATVTIGQIIGQADSTTYNMTLGFQADDYGSNTPVVNSVTLNTSIGTNSTFENLTAHVNATDPNDDNVSLMYDWRKEDVSIAVLNMNFDINNSAGSGETKDYTTYSNNGTVSGATWSATGGWNGSGAYEFDGSASRIDFADDDEYSSSTLTLEAWIKTGGYSGDSAILSKHDTNSGDIEYSLLLNGGEVKLYIDDAGDGSCGGDACYVPITSGASISVGNWYHIVATINDSSNDVDIFVNGVEQTVTDSGGSPSMSNQNEPFRIGAFTCGSGSLCNHFNGSIDNVGIYDYILSSEQIQQLAENRSDLIVSNETTTGDNWSVCVTPFDGENEGSEVCSDNLTIEGETPVVTNLVLNSTWGYNTTIENLTAYATLEDPNGDNVSANYDWRKEGISIAVLNMDFDVNNSAGSGVTKDYSTHSNNGTVTNAVWNATGGWNGTGAYLFDGVDDNITMGDPAEMTIASTMSVEAWVKPYTSSNSDRPMVYSRGEAVFLYYNNSHLLWRVRNTVDATVIADGPVTEGEWVHVVGTYNGSDVVIYIDGELIESNTHTGNIRDDASYDKPNMIGAQYAWHNPSNYYPDHFFNGTIDNVRAYDRTLTADQVSKLYNNYTHSIDADETAVGDNWSVCVTPNDGTNLSRGTCSDTLEIVSTGPPFITSLILNATDKPDNTSNANLTAYVTDYDPDGTTPSLLYDWRTENTSIAVLNMNFDIEDSAGTDETKDYTTYGNNGTITSATWNATSGWNGTGTYDFTDNDGYINISDDASLDFTGAFTVSFWMRGTTTDQAQYLVAKWKGTGSIAWMVDITDGGVCGGGTYSLDFYVSEDGSATDRVYRRECGSTFQDDSWHHVVARFNPGSSIDFFVDGTNTGSVTGTISTVNAVYANNDDLFIGARSDGSTFYNGSIDEVRVYDYSLSSNQILALYNNRSDLIVSNETTVGENWSVCVTPNDGTVDGSEVCSNEVEILAPSVECTIDGDCATGKACLFNYCFSDHGIFILKNDTQNVTFIDSYGRMMIAGTSSTSQGSCTGEFPIQAGGSTVGAISKQGNLCLTGTLSESQSLPLTAPVGGGLLFRNSTGANVGYVDTSGNLTLGLDLIESGFT